MKFQILKNKLRDEVKKKIFDGFGSQAIESTGINGLEEDPISFEIFHDQEFVGAIVVQCFWGQLHIKYLFVEKHYRGQGIARELMNYALEFGKKQGYHFAFVETMSFQAPEFYQKMGFKIEFSRSGYAKDTCFHYLKKNLKDEVDTATREEVTRLGVYGVSIKDGNILLVYQKKGPYAGKLDFPGGGIEFGESPEQALRREFVEEVAMDFNSLQLIENITTTVKVPLSSSNQAYTFFHIGMIYQVSGCRCIEKHTVGELNHVWTNPNTLAQDQCSSLLWKFLQKQL
ncbi:nucleoside triphosphate pyrophosphohydrolase [Candidatus Rubidus massiliensis]|nr:MAG: GNAT family N-acetyltransferase [Chlamydia sp. 32-24]CDZ79865.1 nucleoside triphosphate pyrophosphohydrolase [Candidatus Rubidus massiliensis]